MSNINFDTKIRKILTEKKMSITDFAKELGMTSQNFHRLMKGEDIKLSQLTKISRVLNISLNELLGENSSGNKNDTSIERDDKYYARNNMRILPIVVDGEDKERITFVPLKAAAGYHTKFQQSEYIEQLPTFNLPFFNNGTYRAFEVEGDSMRPTIHTRDIVICRYVDNWYHIRDNNIYLVLGTNGIGIVIKRVLNRLKSDKKLILWSENEFYPPFELTQEEIMEIWEVKATLSMDLEPPFYLEHRFKKLEENISNMVGMFTKILTNDKNR